MYNRLPNTRSIYLRILGVQLFGVVRFIKECMTGCLLWHQATFDLQKFKQFLFGWLCMASWFRPIITCFPLRKVSSSPSFARHQRIFCTLHAGLATVFCLGSPPSPSIGRSPHVATRHILSYQLEVGKDRHHMGWFSTHRAKKSWRLRATFVTRCTGLEVHGPTQTPWWHLKQ